MNKTKVTILRKWNNPQIHIRLTDEEISLDMSLEDFVRALTDEVAEPLVADVAGLIGNPTLIFRNKTLQSKLIEAVESERSQALFLKATERIMEAVKAETVKVV